MNKNRISSFYTLYTSCHNHVVNINEAKMQNLGEQFSKQVFLLLLFPNSLFRFTLFQFRVSTRNWFLSVLEMSCNSCQIGTESCGRSVLWMVFVLIWFSWSGLPSVGGNVYCGRYFIIFHCAYMNNRHMCNINMEPITRSLSVFYIQWL